MKFKLSVLVCSIYKREGNFLRDLLQEFDKQLGECKETTEKFHKYELRRRHYKDVEILICLDEGFKRGGMNVGVKRNLLKKMALGDYCNYHDDDDKPSKDYFLQLLHAIKQGSRDPDTNKRLGDFDVINFWVLFSSPSLTKVVEYDLNFVDHEEKDRFCRVSNHIMCIKKSILDKIDFKPINFGEDADFARRLQNIAKVQGTIRKKLYYYNFNNQTSETQ